MMAELALPWGKFGHPPPPPPPHRARSAKELSWPIIMQSNFCSWNCKGPRRVGSLEYKLTKNEPENVVLGQFILCIVFGPA